MMPLKNDATHGKSVHRRSPTGARVLDALDRADPRPLGLSELSIELTGNIRAAGNLRRVLHRLADKGLVDISRQPSGRGPAINLHAITTQGKQELRKHRSEEQQTEQALNVRIAAVTERHAALEHAQEELSAARERYDHALHEAIAAGATYAQLAARLSEAIGMLIDPRALAGRVSRYALAHGITVGPGRRRTTLTEVNPAADDA